MIYIALVTLQSSIVLAYQGNNIFVFRFIIEYIVA
jgi:hypothetical protein